jgi:hypothetical protein
VSFLGLALGVLGVWRVTHLLHAEDGPGQVVVRLRRLLGNSIIGQAMDCFDCLSLWVAAPCVLLVATGWPERAIAWLALSGGAMVLNRVVAKLEPPPVALHEEDSLENTHVPVWSEATGHFDQN